MFKNYLMVAVRNLLRHKMYSFINIAGLAIGIACTMLILLFVMDELSYEMHHPDVERMYRIIQKTERPGSDPYVSEGASGPLADLAQKEIPEVDMAVRSFRRLSWMHYEDKHFRKMVGVVDAEILDLLHLPLLKGHVRSLEQPGSIFITEAASYLFFGDVDPMGKTLSADYDYLRGEYTVVGVLKDLPENTDVSLDFLTTTRYVEKADALWTEWRLGTSWAPVHVFLKLQTQASVSEVESKLTALLMRQKREDDPAHYTCYLQPVERMHLYGKVDYGLDTTNDIRHVYALTLLGTFVLIIACINLGRAFSGDIASDEGDAFIINETAAQLLGVDEPIGKRFEKRGNTNVQGTIIGVVKDFHVRSLREKMSPLVLYMNKSRAYWLVARIRPQNVSETLAFFERKWDAFLPQRSFYYEFLSDRINEQYYESEMRLEKITVSASLLAVFVACLGLFGLASFTAQQRTKEIGIRKVLGASVSGIITLMSNDFLKLVWLPTLLLGQWPIL